jgi:uncharacterized protein YdhG (YjbR/CyaY superfamily)
VTDRPGTPATIDEYIAQYPLDVQAILQKIREAIRRAVPGAEEAISYRMPTFVLDGHLIYFGAFKSHIGFYPPVRDQGLRRATAAYAGEKGNLRFPLAEPIPYALIARIAKSRAQENKAKKAARRIRGKPNV